ncbi:hypothetical protein AOLI_G00134580 [Acnodon oligacanthus]
MKGLRKQTDQDKEMVGPPVYSGIPSRGRAEGGVGVCLDSAEVGLSVNTGVPTLSQGSSSRTHWDWIELTKPCEGVQGNSTAVHTVMRHLSFLSVFPRRQKGSIIIQIRPVCWHRKPRQ